MAATESTRPWWRHRAVKILGGAAAILALLTLLAALGVILLLGSQSGRLWLVNTGIDKGLGDGPLQVSLEGMRSPALGEWLFERIQVTRDGQPWLDIHQLHLRWAPRELLQKRLLIHSLDVSQLDVHTDGEVAEEPAADTDSGGGTPPPIALESFELRQLNIINERGDIPSFKLAGDLHLFWDELPLLVNLQARSLPGANKTPIALRITSSAETRERLRVEGALTETADGWLGRLLRLPSTAPIDAEFEAVMVNEPDGLRLILHRLHLPFLQYAIRAQGEVIADNDWQRWRFEPLLLGTDEQQHRIAGTVTLGEDAVALDLQTQLDQLPLELFSPWVAQLDTGSVSADLVISGDATDPAVSGSVSGHSEFRQYPVALDMAGEFTLRQLNFSRLQLNFGTSELRADGRLDVDGDTSDLNFQLSDVPDDYLRLLDIERPADLGGRLDSASGRLIGAWRDPSGELTARASGQYRQQPFAVDLRAEGNRGRVQLKAADIRMANTHATVRGILDLEGDESDLQVSLKDLPLSLLTLADVDLPANLEANVNGQAHLRGVLTAPQVNGQLRARGTYQQKAFDINLAGSGSRNAVHLQRAEAVLGPASLVAEGDIDLAQRTVSLNLKLDNAPLTFLELAQIEPPEGLTAEISGSARVNGRWSLPEIVSQLRATGVYEDVPFQLTADGSFVDRRIDIAGVQLELDGLTALEIHGFLHPDAYDLRVTAADLPTQTLSALGWDLVTGDFNADLHIQGTPEAPNIEGRVAYHGSLTGLDLASGEHTSFALGWETHLTTEEQLLTVDSVFTRDQFQTGAFHITLPITGYLQHLREPGDEPFPLDFQANGAVDMAVFNLILDPDIHRISGRAAMRVEGSGDVTQPNLVGVLELLDARYENTLTGTMLADIQLLLQSRGTEVTIAEAKARGRGGHLEASGSVNWLDGNRADAVKIKLTAHNAELLQREDIDGEVSGELALTGSFNELWLKGQLDVTPFSANISGAFQSQIPEIEVTEVYGEPDQEEQALATGETGPTIHLDLTIKAEQQAYLRGRGLEAELAGEIHLSGTLAEPNYEGEFTTVRGVFEVFGRKFVLLPGQVLFANNALYMLIPGEYEAPDYTIRAELVGTVEDLELKLTSVPSLPEDEILSLLIFGKSAQNITPFQAIRLAAAVQTLRGGGGGFDPVGSTRDALGVDTLSIESASTESGTGVAVGVGKYINERVYLELRRTPSEVQPWQGNVEIELSPRLHLRSTTGGEGRTRADLLWKKDY